MEAKDTVMTEAQLTALHNWSRDVVLEAQAEISFKMGVREVVECLQKHCEGVYPKTDGGHTSYMRLFGFEQDEWQKLKEWEV